MMVDKNLDEYWKKMFDQEGINYSLDTLLGRMKFFRYNTSIEDDSDWSHFDSTMDLIEIIIKKNKTESGNGGSMYVR